MCRLCTFECANCWNRLAQEIMDGLVAMQAQLSKFKPSYVAILTSQECDDMHWAFSNTGKEMAKLRKILDKVVEDLKKMNEIEENS